MPWQLAAIVSGMTCADEILGTHRVQPRAVLRAGADRGRNTGRGLVGATLVHSTVLLGAASGVLLAVAGVDIVPHALDEANEVGLSGWVVPATVLTAFVLASAGRLMRRRGESGRLVSAGTAVALVLHRLVEGMTVVLLTSVFPVVAALVVHSVRQAGPARK